MSKHNGINATRDVLKDQLALAADAIIELRSESEAARTIIQNAVAFLREMESRSPPTVWQRMRAVFA